MADYTSDRTGANIDQVLDNADAGNIGKDGTQITVDADTIVNSGFYSLSGASPNLPAVLSGTLVVTGGIGSTFTTQIFTALTSQRAWFRSQNSGTWQPWREIYHDNGNGVTASEAATAIKGAKDGNVGINPPVGNYPKNGTSVLNTDVVTGFYSVFGGTDAPIAGDGNYSAVVTKWDSDDIQLIFYGTGANGGRTFINNYRSATSVWSGWREIYHDNGNGVTAAEAATAIKGAKDGNIGVDVPVFGGDLDDAQTGFVKSLSTSLNTPIAENGFLITNSRSPTNIAQLWINDVDFDRAFIGGTVSGRRPWQELYHTGNTGFASFNATDIPAAPGPSALFLGNNNASIISQRTGVAASTHVSYRNDNGTVGTIRTDGTSTSYNTTSDNRLKSVIGKPTDADIDAKFNDIYDTFTLFNWKNNPDGDAVWGFLAHDVIDKGLDFGSEGEGPRNLNIGDVYEEAVIETEEVEQPVLYKTGDKKGQPRYNADGSPMMETVIVEKEVQPAKIVSPAGVDQSKIVPYLVAKIEQLERRLAALEGGA